MEIHDEITIPGQEAHHGEVPAWELDKRHAGALVATDACQRIIVSMAMDPRGTTQAFTSIRRLPGLYAFQAA